MRKHALRTSSKAVTAASRYNRNPQIMNVQAQNPNCRVQVFKGYIRWTALPEARTEARSLFASREVVLEQTWTYSEEEGVFDIGFASVEHDAAPPPPAWNLWQALVHWSQPVRAQVRAVSLSGTAAFHCVASRKRGTCGRRSCARASSCGHGCALYSLLGPSLTRQNCCGRRSCTGASPCARRCAVP